eukprot:2556073-Rhodomonas_salina.1
MQKHATDCCCGVCVWCVQDAFCTGGTTDQCPDPNMDSPAGADSATDCVCRAGFFQVAAQCFQCPLGSFCPGDKMAYACPPLSNTTHLESKSSAECQCIPGFFQDFSAGLECTACPVGMWCAESIQHACPPHTTTMQSASNHSSQCLCNAGYTAFNASAGCSPCTNGLF